MSKEILRMTLLFNVGNKVSIGVAFAKRQGNLLYGDGTKTLTLQPNAVIHIPNGPTLTGAQLRKALEVFAEES